MIVSNSSFTTWYRYSGTMLLMLLMLCSSCHTPAPQSYTGDNRVYLALEDGATSYTLSDSFARELTFVVRLTSPVSSAVELRVAVTGDGAADLSAPSVSVLTIAAGATEARFGLTTQVRQLIQGKRTAEVHLTSSSSALILPTTPFVITIQPQQSAELSERERELLSHYQSHYGVDLLAVLGTYSCEGTVKWAGFKDGDYDYPDLVAERTVQISQQMMTVELSERADREHPMLTISSNAFGVAPFVRTVWEKLTILDRIYWNPHDTSMAAPYPQEVRKRIGWSAEQASSESFDVQLYDIPVDLESGTLQLLAPLAQSVRYPDYPYSFTTEETDRIVVPLHFETSVWRRIVEQTAADPLFREQAEGADMDIYDILNSSGVDSDSLAEDIEETRYVEPAAKITFDSQLITATFPIYVRNSDRFTIVGVKCKRVGS